MVGAGESREGVVVVGIRRAGYVDGVGGCGQAVIQAGEDAESGEGMFPTAVVPYGEAGVPRGFRGVYEGAKVDRFRLAVVWHVVENGDQVGDEGDVLTDYRRGYLEADAERGAVGGGGAVGQVLEDVEGAVMG